MHHLQNEWVCVHDDLVQPVHKHDAETHQDEQYPNNVLPKILIGFCLSSDVLSAFDSSSYPKKKQLNKASRR